MKEYVHYGSKEFDINLFNQIRNIPSWGKPIGGLWASAMDAKYGWKQWCENNEFSECNKNNSFKFTLIEDANVFHIYSIKDLPKLPKMLQEPYALAYNNEYFIDFEKSLLTGIDAIELHLSEEIRDYNNYMESLYYALYGWDCDCILILNPEVVVPIE